MALLTKPVPRGGGACEHGSLGPAHRRPRHPRRAPPLATETTKQVSAPRVHWGAGSALWEHPRPERKGASHLPIRGAGTRGESAPVTDTAPAPGPPNTPAFRPLSRPAPCGSCGSVHPCGDAVRTFCFSLFLVSSIPSILRGPAGNRGEAREEEQRKKNL